MKIETLKIKGQEWPLERHGAMLIEAHSEDGTWAAYAESGPAKGNITWETEAIPVAILRPKEIVLSREEFDRIWEYCRDYSTDYTDLKTVLTRELFG